VGFTSFIIVVGGEGILGIVVGGMFGIVVEGILRIVVEGMLGIVVGGMLGIVVGGMLGIVVGGMLGFFIYASVEKIGSKLPKFFRGNVFLNILSTLLLFMLVGYIWVVVI
jgi:hypothetical protein